MVKKRILIVDDEPIVLKSLHWGLSEQGYAVECAESGEEGLARLEQDSYHLLISDLLMEGMDGIELIKRAKALYPDMAVCLLTGYADLSSAIEALRLGADDYLMKPCELTELFMRVERALAREDLRKRVRYFENILPVCAVCKKIRDDTGKEPGEGEWVELEQYLRRKTGICINQVCCEQCAQKKKQEDSDSSNIR
ncbi:MAG: sigma-54-dependent transcriptional regulator [Thermodesulfobacteriota bacterium]